MTGRDAPRSALFPPFDTCPGCAATGLRAQAAGDQAIFACPACHSYWHIDLGWIHRVAGPDSRATGTPGCRLPQ